MSAISSSGPPPPRRTAKLEQLSPSTECGRHHREVVWPAALRSPWRGPPRAPPAVSLLPLRSPSGTTQWTSHTLRLALTPPAPSRRGLAASTAASRRRTASPAEDRPMLPACPRPWPSRSAAHPRSRRRLRPAAPRAPRRRGRRQLRACWPPPAAAPSAAPARPRQRRRAPVGRGRSRRGEQRGRHGRARPRPNRAPARPSPTCPGPPRRPPTVQASQHTGIRGPETRGRRS
mmetsp:Transcript_154/g.503  ORF Transcript_154/g.503 Transcript_154/m.503 type:complete len:232 (+) Transcript_154:282-977(+)